MSCIVAGLIDLFLDWLKSSVVAVYTAPHTLLSIMWLDLVSNLWLSGVLNHLFSGYSALLFFLGLLLRGEMPCLNLLSHLLSLLQLVQHFLFLLF